jgi:L-threonylcarbamoyladenylate synthase
MKNSVELRVLLDLIQTARVGRLCPRLMPPAIPSRMSEAGKCDRAEEALWPSLRCTTIPTGMTETLVADANGIARAAGLLREGRLVAFGTETVYGLGADATNAEAVAGIFAAKERPRFNPLISHYPDADAAFAHVVPNPTAQRLAAALWPGPLTLVLPRRADCPVALLTGAGLDTLAVRVPAQETARALLRGVGRPVAAPSANRSGRVSPTIAAHVLAELDGRIDAVLDSGACPVGVESTVLDLSSAQPVLLRPGGATLEAIEAVIGPALRGVQPGSAVRSPGMLASHYAPSLPLRLQASDLRPDEALLAFGEPLPGAGVVFNLSERGDLTEAAARLFSGLRWLDAEASRCGLMGIAAMAVPETGLGLAINDRLRRAAAPRGAS